MAETSGQERTEKPTGKRRRDFRNKGQVAQSKEVNSALLLTATLILWYFYLPGFFEDLTSLVSFFWRRCTELTISPTSTPDLAFHLVGYMGGMLWPLLFLVVTIGVIATLMQVGFLFTTKPLQPDLAKFNPIAGMKKFVSLRSLVEIVKSLAKVFLVAWVLFLTIKSEFENAILLMDMEVIKTFHYLAKVAWLVILRSCGILIVLAILDYIFVRWQMEEKMKMTKQEVKEEHKDREGDPKIKSQIRKLQMRMARQRMMAEVPKADVVITNPTHISVALVYKREEMEAPKIVAAGAGHVALKIRKIAGENNVPVVENPPLARMLYKTEIGSFVPEHLYKAVAEVLAYVYGLKNGGARR